MTYIFEICAKKIYTLTPDNNRALESKKMYKKIKDINNNTDVAFIEDIKDILNIIEENDNEIYAFTGSLYLIGEVRKILKIKFKLK